MRKDRNKIDVSKPALILTYGSCPGKVLPLDRELLVIGRAPACDLVLNSPEVSPVHCLIVKTAVGWLLRNTNPRAGTQLNGEAIQDVRLCDDDSLQIGTFSFKVHLPAVDGDAPGTTAAVADPALTRLQTSREKLVRLAWSLRRRLLQQQPVVRAEKQALADRYTDLEQRSHAVDARQRECENLLQLLVEQEDEVNNQRQGLLQAAADFETFRHRTEAEIAQQVIEAETYIHNNWEQCQAQQREVEEHAASALRELELRKNELAHYARHLRRLGLNAPPPAPDAELAALRQENERLHQESACREGALQARADEGVREGDALRAQLEASRDDLKRLQEQEAVWKKQADRLADADALRTENEQLHQRIIELGDVLHEKLRLQARADEQWQEVLTLRERLQAKDGELRRFQAAAPPDTQEQAELVAAVETLLRENEAFRRRLLDQARALREQEDLEKRFEAAQAEAAALRTRLHVQTEVTEYGIQLPEVDKEATAPVQPNKYLRQENEELKAQVAAQAGALRDREHLRELTAALEAEVAALQARLGERVAAPRPADSGWHELIAPDRTASLRVENEELRGRLSEQQDRLVEASRLRAEFDTLRAAADGGSRPPPADDARDALIVELRGEVGKLKEDLDHDNRVAYEALLGRERQVLADEQGRLERELANLREDRAELDGAAQTAELQIARERVQITREWAELNRKREEFRMEVEKEKRDTIRDNLDHVRRIKEEAQVKRGEALGGLVAQRIGDRRRTEPA